MAAAAASSSPAASTPRVVSAAVGRSHGGASAAAAPWNDGSSSHPLRGTKPAASPHSARGCARGEARQRVSYKQESQLLSAARPHAPAQGAAAARAATRRPSCRGAPAAHRRSGAAAADVPRVAGPPERAWPWRTHLKAARLPAPLPPRGPWRSKRASGSRCAPRRPRPRRSLPAPWRRGGRISPCRAAASARRFGALAPRGRALQPRATARVGPIPRAALATWRQGGVAP